jgi:hypothetical protein
MHRQPAACTPLLHPHQPAANSTCQSLVCCVPHGLTWMRPTAAPPRVDAQLQGAVYVPFAAANSRCFSPSTLRPQCLQSCPSACLLNRRRHCLLEQPCALLHRLFDPVDDPPASCPSTHLDVHAMSCTTATRRQSHARLPNSLAPTAVANPQSPTLINICAVAPQPWRPEQT